MKTKLLLAIMFTCTIFNLKAQNNFQKGSLLLGGNINFYNNKYKSDPQQSTTNSAFSITPSAGIAISNNLFIGLNIGFGFNKRNNFYSNPVNPDSTKTFTYNYGVFVRKYKPLKHNFFIFLQGDLGGFNSTEKNNTSDPTKIYSNKGFGLNASLSPGISYSINSRLQLETGLNGIVGFGYAENKIQNNSAIPEITKSSTVSAYTNLNNFSSQLFFGFRLLLQKKDKMVASSK